MDFWAAAFWTLLPTVLVSLIFFFVLRSIVRADRTERRVYAKVDAEERAKRGLPPRAAASTPSESCSGAQRDRPGVSARPASVGHTVSPDQHARGAVR